MNGWQGAHRSVQPADWQQFPTSPDVLCRIEWWGRMPALRDVCRLREYVELMEVALAEEAGRAEEGT